MTVAVVTPPVPILTFAEVSKHLVGVPAEDQAHVEALTAAAVAWIDGPTGSLGRALGMQLLEWRPTAWPCGNARWPIPSMVEVESVSYVDTTGATQAWAVPDPVWFADMPAWRGRPGDLRIRYWAGYGGRDPNDATKWINDVPAPVQVAIMMLVAQWYNTREATVVGQAPAQMPFAVDALLAPYRIWRV